ncbi:MAG: Rid family hydrolase [Paracoccus sp. (in: a-proteobacteria)]|uniref:Rid family hydrolase n=1 Tax=Paracoccus sp. TaxID=267 RepID=UPI003919E9DA
MSIQKTGRIDSWGPKIFLGSAAGDIASVCLTAPDKACDFVGQTWGILGVIDDLLGQMDSDRARLIGAQVWLADMADWPAFVPVWNDWVGDAHAPGLSVVQMAASRRDSLLEIRVWAARPAAA